ncbi:CAAX prenyl protease-like protein [Arcicella aurantiaca]|uniref:CAAX prenyl protease-like protein n=1 Tax=Arcicella aurantiaca TaxID=591202 RepID=A0A316ECG7_9BACT|nr:CPBP family intramembrane glutamic endopeptidase [Arcicella aurantiaca]PWK28572.1 CAAX prenyl protease-like protein [Arcicella aurantiaca]
MELTFTPANVSWNRPKSEYKKMAQEFLNYIKNPSYVFEESTMPLQLKIASIKQLLKFKLSLLPIIFLVIFITKKLTGAESVAWDKNWTNYLMIVAFAPIFEELTFRYALRCSKTAIAVMILMVVWLIVKFTVKSNQDIAFIVGITFSLIPVIRLAIKPFDNQLEKQWIRFFPFIFHFSAIIFGLMHLTNFEHINNYFLAIPLVCSQFVSGYVLGFVRMKFGLFYSMGLHAVWNFIASFPILIMLIAKLF